MTIEGFGGEEVYTAKEWRRRAKERIAKLEAELERTKEMLWTATTYKDKVAEQLQQAQEERDALVRNFEHNTRLLIELDYMAYVENGVAIEDATRKEIE